MLRAFFLAMGICCLVLGLQCLVVEKAELAGDASATSFGQQREIEPPEWAPWSLMSVGAVVILYTFTIPKKMTG